MDFLYIYLGTGSTCSNFDNFNGFVFGDFVCPLPASTGMNALDQFCCGPRNYQYCCNAECVFLKYRFIIIFLECILTGSLVKLNVVPLPIIDLPLDKGSLHEQHIHLQQNEYSL